MIRLGVLGSTRGTNLQALLNAINAGTLAAEIAIVISNKADALILNLARTANIATQFISATGLTREAYDAQLHASLQAAGVDLVVLIGYMRILSREFVQQWQGKILNVHPSLLPAYAGLMDRQVHAAVLAAKEKETGCTVHWVTAEVDAGPILLQRTCPVSANDTVDELKARVQALEGEALIAAIAQLNDELNPAGKQT
jgi:phosphoribosylglycinamide formyltransferase-1